MNIQSNKLAVGLLSIMIVIAFGSAGVQSILALPPGVEDIDLDEITKGSVVSLGSSDEAKAEMEKTANQKPYVRPEKSEDAKSGASTTDLITYLTIFVLAIFLGFEIITKVPPTLHTPLMSGSNAISGITLVGAILAGGISAPISSSVLAFLAVTFATINVVGGFLVTHRMLAMFRKKG